MPTCKLPRLMIAATASGSGKTTITCALLRALIKRGYRTASFKCGPDYIDPIFHREVIGVSDTGNLDLFLSDFSTVCWQMSRRSDADLTLIEGVMGYYDGIALSHEASSYAVAKVTSTPTLLVLNCRGMAASIAAQVKGFTDFLPDSGISGVLLNNLTPSLYPGLKELVEYRCGIPVVGYLPHMPDCVLSSRHLGLTTGYDAAMLLKKLDLLAEQMEESVDLELLVRIADSAPPLSFVSPDFPKVAGNPKIAVARDLAFQFYYDDALALLRELGAELSFFSPLQDVQLPKEIDGLYLGGGYPELYAGQLSENRSMRRCIYEAVMDGMPTVAECGGFLYLHQTLENEVGISHPMAGVIPAEAKRGRKLEHFGYVTLTCGHSGLLCETGETLKAHEFHYWQSTDPGDAFVARKPQRETCWNCVHASDTLYAGFPHLCFTGNPKAAARFLKAAVQYQRRRTE